MAQNVNEVNEWASEWTNEKQKDICATINRFIAFGVVERVAQMTHNLCIRQKNHVNFFILIQILSLALSLYISFSFPLTPPVSFECSSCLVLKTCAKRTFPIRPECIHCILQIKLSREKIYLRCYRRRRRVCLCNFLSFSVWLYATIHKQFVHPTANKDSASCFVWKYHNFDWLDVSVNLLARKQRIRLENPIERKKETK